jgi:hypothetical protein
VSIAERRRVVLPDAVFEVRGSGEPMMLIQTALVADEFLPLASQSELQDTYRVILLSPPRLRGQQPGPGTGLH